MTKPNIIREPRIYVVGRQNVDRGELERFLGEYGMSWETDTEIGGEQLVEAGGRLCYVSYGKGRKTNAEYVTNIIESKHGSVLEHAVWNFIIAGVSRSFTHELIRHRAGWGYSQLSQRYVDESEANYVEPALIAADPELHALWQQTIETSHEAYVRLTEALAKKLQEQGVAGTTRRKMARESARSVLPNATETMIFVTANARALRHFIELRGSEGAEAEIRGVALEFLRIMQHEAPNLFADYKIEKLPDGREVATTPNEKV
ncbi:MAG: FAD-dependent thymidylate synthase [Chloroflexota bacterium]